MIKGVDVNNGVFKRANFCIDGCRKKGLAYARTTGENHFLEILEKVPIGSDAECT